MVFKLSLSSWQNKDKIQLLSSLQCSSVAFRSVKSGSFGLIKTSSKLRPNCRLVPVIQVS